MGNVVGGISDQFFDVKILRDMMPGLLTEAVKNTVIYTAVAFPMSMIFGLLLALGRLSKRRIFRWPASMFVDVIRGLPALLTILIIGLALPIAFEFRWSSVGGRFAEQYLPQCLSLSLVMAAYMAETIRAGIQAVPNGQIEAARSLGMSSRSTMRKVVLPQAFRIIIPPLTNELAALFKDTSLLAILGTFDGGRELLQYARGFANSRANSTPFVAAGLGYLAITLPLLRAVAALENRTRRGPKAANTAAPAAGAPA